MSNKAGKRLVPALRFPEFRENGNWADACGGDVFVQVNNRQHDSNLPVLAITKEYGAIPRDEIDYRVFVTDKSIESYKVVEVGDFIISLRSFQGGIEYSSCRGICSPAYVILRKKADIFEAFFKQLFKTDKFIRQLNKNIAGLRDGKMVSFKQFSELQLPVPLKAEQKKITNCLSSTDDIISAQAKKIEALKTHKKGLMQQLFPAEGETVPRLRFSKFQNAGEWQAKKMANILQKISNPVDVELNGFYREIGIRSHGKGIFHKEMVSGSRLGDKRVFWVEEDTLILNIVFAWEQAVATVSKEEDGMIASHRFPMFKGKSKTSVDFVKHFLLTNKGKFLLGLASPGGAGRNRTLGQKEFENLEFHLPVDLDEQVLIADCLSSLDTLITAHTQKLDILKAHKTGLMQGLFPSINEVEA